MKGQKLTADAKGFSKKKCTERQSATRMTIQVREQIWLPVITKALVRLPYGWKAVRQWPELLMKLKLPQGKARKQRPLRRTRSASESAFKNPHVKSISCITGSLPTSYPCLSCSPQTNNYITIRPIIYIYITYTYINMCCQVETLPSSNTVWIPSVLVVCCATLFQGKQK